MVTTYCLTTIFQQLQELFHFLLLTHSINYTKIVYRHFSTKFLYNFNRLLQNIFGYFITYLAKDEIS